MENEDGPITRSKTKKDKKKNNIEIKVTKNKNVDKEGKEEPKIKVEIPKLDLTVVGSNKMKYSKSDISNLVNTYRKNKKRKQKEKDSESDVDEHGNIKDLIDYDYDSQNEEIEGERSIIDLPLLSKKRRKNEKGNFKSMILKYICMRLSDHMNNEMSSTTKYNLRDKEKVDYKSLNNISDLSDMEVSSTDNSYSTESENSLDFAFDEEYMEFWSNLPEEKWKKFREAQKEVDNFYKYEVPPKYRILLSELDIKSKALVMKKLDTFQDMDDRSSEYNKLKNWIDGYLRIPFGVYHDLPIKLDIQESKITNLDDISTYIHKSKQILDESVYGHIEAKTDILHIISKWISNPGSIGNVLAIQGPPGNGKTTLVKEGISRALNRPFAFIALGGATDSSFLEGHGYTYEGSLWGKIVQILMDTKCMNPIIYMDELDKISETKHGEEIVGILTHLTDPSQNSQFHDKYFEGIDFDLSRVLFIFSYNDPLRINPILNDRLTNIYTKGFNEKDKVKIAKDYLLPKLLETVNLTNSDVIFDEEVINYIIKRFSSGEEGVRCLRRTLESIVQKINTLRLVSENKDISLPYQIENFKLPIQITPEIVKNLFEYVKDSVFIDKPPEGMYI